MSLFEEVSLEGLDVVYLRDFSREHVEYVHYERMFGKDGFPPRVHGSGDGFVDMPDGSTWYRTCVLVINTGDKNWRFLESAWTEHLERKHRYAQGCVSIEKAAMLDIEEMTLIPVAKLNVDANADGDPIKF